MGVYSNLEEAAKSVLLKETINPQKQDHAIYARYYQIFERLSFKLKDEFEEITNLQHQ